jgi:pimeloyl-ACP methyl ester carboxylesterase
MISRAPVVLVHRAGGVAAEWDEVRQALARQDPERTFLAVDLPGRPGSQEDHPRTAAALAEAVVDAVIALDEGPAVLAGHSMGGAVSMQAALDFPGWVRGLVLVASSPELRLAREVVRAIEEGDALSDPGFGQDMFGSSVEPGRRVELTRRLAAVPASVLRMDLEAAWRLDLRGRLAELGVPVRIVAGRDDRLISVRKSQIFRDSLPGSSLRVVQGAGHMLVWEAVEAVALEILELARQVDAS